jgi:GNAT superfamily N-acetyltransferase
MTSANPRSAEAVGFAGVGYTLDGQLAGFVWVAKVRNESTGQPEACLLNQFVAQVHRGQGLGHGLMETAEE